MKESIHVCKVKEKLDRTSPPQRSEFDVENLMPYDKIVSS